VPGAHLSDPTDVASIGMTAPDMPAPAAILGAVAARPGLMTRADLPLRGFAGRLNPQVPDQSRQRVDLSGMFTALRNF